MCTMWLNLFLFFILFITIQSELDLFRPKTVRIYQFKGLCPEYENANMYYSDIQIQTVDRTVYVSMKVHIRNPVNNNMKLWLFLSRCTSRDALDSCETYNTIKINHFCKLLNAENKPWTPFVEQFEPPIKCPLKPGLYVVNSTFDGSAFNRFPVMDWYWKITVNLRDEVTSVVLMCIQLEGQIAPI